MENSVVINQKPMNVKEYKGQRVLTFKDIDTVHGRPEGTASRNFKANRKHFIEGVDFYNVQKDEIRLIGITSPRGAIAITESGYLMLAKSLTDELAWKVQRELVNNYFRVKPQQECKQMTFDDYSYFDKRFRGQPVLSVADISAMLNVDRSTLGYSVRRYLKQGQDFYFLEKAALAEFKLENPKLYRHIGSMYVVTQSGFDKLCKIYGIKVDKPKLFIEEKTQNEKKTEHKKAEYCIMLGDNFIQEEIERCKNYLVAIAVEIDRCNKHNIEVNEMAVRRKTLEDMVRELSSRICILVHHKLRTTTEYKF